MTVEIAMPLPLNSVEIAKNLIACPSITPIEGGALDYLQRILEELGFTCYRLPFAEAGTEPVDNLYARLGTISPNLCFAGHTDVVPPGNESEWTTAPFNPSIREGKIYGRGVVDMKGAIAAWVGAVSSYITKGMPLAGSLSFLITGDEEGVAINGTKKVLQWLKEQGETVDACIVGEPTNPKELGEMIKIGRRGSVTFHIRVDGVQGHAAYPALADNPVTRLVEIVHTLKSRVLDEGSEFFEPSNLEITTFDVGNKADNVIPAHATAHVNIRFNDHHQSATLIDWVRDVCQEYAPQHELKVMVTGESFITKPGVLADAVVTAVHSVTGKTPQLSTSGGTSDARFIKDICPVVECGLINATAHKVNEHCEVSEIEQLAAIYEAVIRQVIAN